MARENKENKDKARYAKREQESAGERQELGKSKYSKIYE
jgi:hypothetical protein